MVLNIVFQKFEEFCLPPKNFVFEMHKFNSCKQNQGENIDQFVTELKTRAKTCELGELENRLIMSQVVCGITDNTVRDKLLRVPDLTLEKCLQMCKTAEIVSAQASALNMEAAFKTDIHANKKTHGTPCMPQKSTCFQDQTSHQAKKARSKDAKLQEGQQCSQTWVW